MPLPSKITIFCTLLFLFAVTTPAQDGTTPFITNCASCHAQNSPTHAPPPEVLKQMPWKKILEALETGVMKAQGDKLPPSLRVAIAKYAGKEEAGTPVEMTGFCPTNAAKPATLEGNSWNGWGVDNNNSRFQPAPAGGITAADVPKLKLKWAFGFPDEGAAYGQPTIVGGRVYVGSGDGTVYSLDAQTGCIYWRFHAKSVIRNAVVIGPGPRAYFGDLKANYYSLDASTGKLLWERKLDEQPFARISGTSKLHDGRLYVPIASQEENAGANVNYPCCTFRGSLMALNAETGEVIWKSYTVPPPKQTSVGKSGTAYFGPSGATIWSSPTLDLKRNLVYVATGNSYSAPTVETADAVVAMDLKTGTIQWAQQANPDVYNWNCEKRVSPEAGSCPADHGEDVDFGSSAILMDLGGGKDVLVAGQKSGVVHAFDPGQKGKILWQTRIGHGGIFGGVLWGMSANNGLVFAALSDLQFEKPNAGGGLFALDAATGKVVWHAPPAKLDCPAKMHCNSAQMAATTAVPGAVFSGAMDGHLRAYDAQDGKVIWDFNAVQNFKTVNGIEAKGGAFSSSGPTVADGILYVNSGYWAVPGNVLLAFSAK